MSERDLIQGSPGWIEARVGSLGASRVHDAMAKTKSGWGASRANVMAELIAERLTGIPAEQFVNQAMQWGSATEPEARSAYEFRTDNAVEIVGLIRHPTIAGTHASPDGLIGADGLIEVKCPNTAGHLDTLLGQTVAAKYITQMHWQMICSARKWCDFVSFDPRLPESMRLFVKRVPLDQAFAAELEREVRGFIVELDAKVERLLSIYERSAA